MENLPEAASGHDLKFDLAHSMIEKRRNSMNEIYHIDLSFFERRPQICLSTIDDFGQDLCENYQFSCSAEGVKENIYIYRLFPSFFSVGGIYL